MNASDAVYRGVPKILYLWNVKRNVLSRVQDDLGTIRLSLSGPNGKMKQNSVETDVFMAKYYKALVSESESEFKEHFTSLRELSSITADYLDRT
ncbi:hypothetical protein F441_06855 [Phytophthora nicotianae CJ01A1]|uniref:Uncharacterized protein n=3 Tax=Phytophthora nicotianae TaxID=4792 RepID=W2RFP2_PHYN3|nr:hypothetical protein PPTG_02931 [Phytophthora nicotianae INRA-310]ETN23335.1 hypothetical protein PPTG_02931 [Phytophthora nicotianae INRA-310]ETP19001.1 hypothetical protein F441_06855 [Phytophthora nicotianae CJ01A1]ETP46967.1 hypothetical protein F442_06890 [Phytophthora nicotianae P10297]